MKAPRRAMGRVVMVCCLLLLSATAWAQSSIVGVVRDTSGGVLPGVTVEASSPALIQGARAVVTDQEGRYQVVDLRPGPYTVTFTLGGFRTLKRDGIELPANFAATVDAELSVGALEEPVTVSGEAPVVDIHSVGSRRSSRARRWSRSRARDDSRGWPRLFPGRRSTQ